MRDEVCDMVKPLDHCAETKASGLIASRPMPRPADILNSVPLPGRLAALDIGIVCPAAAGAGADCTESMDRRKRDRIEPFTAERGANGVEYAPMVFSCHGRPHHCSIAVIRAIAEAAARRQGLTCIKS